MKSLRRIINIKIICLIALFLVCKQISAQPDPANINGVRHYTISSCLDGLSPGTLRAAIIWANGVTPTTYTTNQIEIDINVNGSGPNCSVVDSNFCNNKIILKSSLDPIILNNGMTLRIKANKTVFDGIAPDRTINWIGALNQVGPLAYALRISNVSGSKVILDNLVFCSWDDILRRLQTVPAVPYVKSVFVNECVIIDGTGNVDVLSCRFDGFLKAIDVLNEVSTVLINDCDFNAAANWPIRKFYNCRFDVGDPFQTISNQTHIWDTLLPNSIDVMDQIKAAVYYSGYGSRSQLGSAILNVTNNRFTGFGNAPVGYQAFLVDPLVSYAIPNFYCWTSASAKSDITFSGNTINNFQIGVYQDDFPLKSGLDQTYKLKINNNEFHVSYMGVTYLSPFKHFELKGNDFYGIQGYSYNIGNGFSPIIGYTFRPYYLYFSYSLWGGLPNCSGAINPPIVCAPYNFMTNNFGFELIGSATPALNNRFHEVRDLQGNIVPEVWGDIHADGNFGDTTVPVTLANPRKGIYFENLDLNSTVSIEKGRPFTLLNCKMRACAGSQDDSKPITLYGLIGGGICPGGQGANPTNGIIGNYGIRAPVLNEANIVALAANSPTIIQVDFDLVGSIISDPTNGPFRVSFYRSVFKSSANPDWDNTQGDIIELLGTVDLSGVGNYVHNVTINAGQATVGYGDRIAVNVTALGTLSSNKAPFGTSEFDFLPLQKCPKCLDPFSPIPGKSYVVSGWAKLEDSYGAKSYKDLDGFASPGIKVTLYSNYPDSVQITPPFFFECDGPIIDGWQRIQGEFTIPLNAKGINIETWLDFSHNSGNNNVGISKVKFDDIRFYPADGLMKTYVYDTDTKRLSAVLDENNYATFYEYDADGKLLRIKKETESGVQTLKESRNSQPIR